MKEWPKTSPQLGMRSSGTDTQRTVHVPFMDSALTIPAPFTGMGMPTLEVWYNGAQPRQIYTLVQDELQIGRDASNDIVLDIDAVSDFHAQIVHQGDLLILVHPHPARAATRNGLFYKGRHIPGNEVFRKPLIRGDIFRIGDENGSYVSLTFNDGSDADQSIAPIMRPVPLKSKMLTIGRQPDNMLVLDHPQVSNYHACLMQESQTYRIVDQKSTNHVYVNGERVRECSLEVNDEISIGPFVFMYTGTHLLQYAERRGIHLDAVHLAKKVRHFARPAETLLDDISLSLPPQSLTAIIGGSGAGKSTLMDALNGLRPAHKGQVFYNGKNYYIKLKDFSTQLGYVPQDDIVHRDLSVRRALYYAARLRLPEKMSPKEIRQRIDTVLRDVDLLEKANLSVGKLSGGQRKRLSIALELLGQPRIFFLDEPTSGLDPGLDRKIMFILRKLADTGQTVVINTHSIQNLYICDYLCLLTPGGRLAYLGPPQDALAYFHTNDFVELYHKVEPTRDNPDVPLLAQQRFEQSDLYTQYVRKPQQLIEETHAVDSELQRQEQKASRRSRQKRRRRKVGALKQYRYLTLRSLELLKNDTGTLLVLLLQAPLIGLLLLLLIKFGIGQGVFNPNSIVQCPTTQNILAPNGAVIPPDVRHPIVSVNCGRLALFLQTSHVGQELIAHKGGLNQAVESFMVIGPGGNAQMVLFCMVFAAFMFGAINSIREIVKEAAIHRRERAVNLRVVPYIFSKVTVLGVLCLLQSAILTLLINSIVPFQRSIFLPPLLEIYVTLALVCLVGMMVGLAVSALAPSADRAMSFLPLLLIPQIVCSGAIFPFKDQGMQIFAMFFASRWALAALGSTVGLHSETMNHDALYKNILTFHGTLYASYGVDETRYYLLLAWGVLVGMILVLMLLTIYWQKRKGARR